MQVRRHSIALGESLETLVGGKRKLLDIEQTNPASLEGQILVASVAAEEQVVEAEDEDEDDAGEFYIVSQIAELEYKDDKYYSQDKQYVGLSSQNQSEKSQLGVLSQEKSEEKTCSEVLHTPPSSQNQRNYHNTQEDVCEEPLCGEPGTPRVREILGRIFETPVLTQCGVIDCQTIVEKDKFRSVAPLFKIASQRKHICLIRHGESEYNARFKSKRLGGGGRVFDARLTEEGKQQARQVLESRQFEKVVKSTGLKLEDALWVISPLTRAIQTFLYACMDGESRLFGKLKPCKVVLQALMREGCFTTGDVGRPLCNLKQEFPEFFEMCQGEDEVKEQWWHKPADNCALQKKGLVKESKADFQARVDRFSGWLSRRPEKLIVLVGHGMFFRQFGKLDRIMENAEVVRMIW